MKEKKRRGETWTNLEKILREGRGKGNKGKLTVCLRVGRGGTRREREANANRDVDTEFNKSK